MLYPNGRRHSLADPDCCMLACVVWRDQLFPSLWIELTICPLYKLTKVSALVDHSSSWGYSWDLNSQKALKFTNTLTIVHVLTSTKIVLSLSHPACSEWVRDSSRAGTLWKRTQITCNCSRGHGPIRPAPSLVLDRLNESTPVVPSVKLPWQRALVIHVLNRLHVFYLR